MTKRVGTGLRAFSVVSILLVAGSALAPTVAHAGVISDVFSAFTSTVQAFTNEVVSSNNVQTMALPAPATNIDPKAATGGGDITVVDESALLSEDGPSGTAADIKEPQSHQISIYVVRPGDTISGIAAMFDVSVPTVMWGNGLSKGEAIHVGQTLTILPITGVKYTVKKGDTLPSIAKKYSGDVDEILQFNGLANGAKLAVGTEIIIPNGEMTATPVTTKKTVKSSSGRSSKIPAEPLHDAGGPSYAGYFTVPLSHYIETQGLHGYNAVDLGAPTGTQIMASADGDVIISRSGGWNGGYGTYVVISHDNGTQTLYAHMSKDVVSVGQHVVQGQVIGYVGSTGLSTGAHLHFEIRGAQNPF